METAWIFILFFVFLFLCFKGVKQTFQRQPVVAIICMIFLFPVYVIWVFVEMVAKKPEKQEQKIIIVEKEKE